jgi:energy-coupling factor transporter ATP-binding protein EcfA2
LQLLWHLYRAREAETIVLDEPEVYLHPDLQRRLVRLLEQLSVQIIMASHSADVIAEAPQNSIVWVDRRTNTSRRAGSDRALNALSASLGTAFNLAVARAQRTRLVLATDCDDVRVLQVLAKRVGALNLADESKVTFVTLKDTARWEGREGLGAAIRQALPSGLPAVVLLQRGQRPDADIDRLRRILAAPNIELAFLGSVEIDNYLLDSEALARASGAAPFAIEEHIDRVIEGLSGAAKSQYLAGTVAGGSPKPVQDVVEEAERHFDGLWATSAGRRTLVRGSDVLDGINLWLEQDGYRCVTSLSAARALRGPELPAELFETLLWLDRMASAL